MAKEMSEAMAAAHAELLQRRLDALCRHEHPAVICAALAPIIARWITGHPLDLQEEVTGLLLDRVATLTREYNELQQAQLPEGSKPS